MILISKQRLYDNVTLRSMRRPRYNRSSAPDDPQKDNFKMATAHDTPPKRVKLIFQKAPPLSISLEVLRLKWADYSTQVSNPMSNSTADNLYNVL